MIATALGETGILIVWIVAILAVLAAIVLAGLAIRLKRPRLGLAGLVPLAAGVLAAAFGLDLAPPDPALRSGLALALGVLGVLGGYPITVFVLGLAAPKRRRGRKQDGEGEHGGIVVDTGDAADGKPGKRGKREVLRGGWVIGYLERLAVVVAVALGRFEIVAAVIAVKGLGRFTELDTPEARERFLVGTLTSLSWAAAFGLLVVVARG